VKAEEPPWRMLMFITLAPMLTRATTSSGESHNSGCSVFNAKESTSTMVGIQTASSITAV